MSFSQNIASHSLAVAVVCLFAQGCAKEETLPLTCTQLGVGASKVILGNTGTKIKSMYTLTRVSDSGYRATVDPEFIEVGGAQNPALHSHYRDKLQRCLTKITPFLKGADGATLEIVLGGPGLQTSDIPAPPQIQVRTDANSTARSNAQFWSAGLNDCASMLHEAFHWLGLPDEYEETEVNMGCRALGPDNSLMTSPSRAYLAAAVDVGMTRLACLCGSQACVTEAKKLAATRVYECPPDAVGSAHLRSGTYWFGEHPEWREGTTVDTPEGVEVTMRLSRMVGPRDAPRTSLLYAGEFRAITQPGCTMANSLFYACSNYTYSRAPGALLRGGECRRSLPSGCNDPQRWVQ